MTVSRSITVTYDAPDDVTAATFEAWLESALFGGEWPHRTGVSDISMASEPVRPVDPAWMASDGHC